MHKKWTLLSTMPESRYPSVRKTAHLNSHDIMMQKCPDTISVRSVLLVEVYFSLRKCFFSRPSTAGSNDAFCFSLPGEQLEVANIATRELEAETISGVASDLQTLFFLSWVMLLFL